jgi:zinc transporter ZupT
MNSKTDIMEALLPTSSLVMCCLCTCTTQITWHARRIVMSLNAGLLSCGRCDGSLSVVSLHVMSHQQLLVLISGGAVITLSLTLLLPSSLFEVLSVHSAHYAVCWSLRILRNSLQLHALSCCWQAMALICTACPDHRCWAGHPLIVTIATIVTMVHGAPYGGCELTEHAPTRRRTAGWAKGYRVCMVALYNTCDDDVTLYTTCTCQRKSA